MTNQATLSFDGWTLHRESGDLTRGDKKVRLQELSLQVLVELTSRPGELVTREQLIAKLWPQGVVDFENGLNTAVSKLRTALGDGGETPRYIETVPRKGYRFIGNASNEVSPASSSKRKSPLLWLTGTLVVAIAIAVFATIYFATSKPEHVRLAVLPFNNLSPDPANAFFTDGIHEELLTALANRATNMDVISRTTMMTYRGQSKATRDIAKELNVTHVLEGSVRREGQTVRVTLQLIDARDDNHVWSNNYDRQLTNAMTLQSQLAQEVATQLSIKLAAPSADLPASTNSEAYDLYLKGKLAVQLIDQRTPPADVQTTEDWLTRAIELDEAFAAAYVQRAQLRIIRYGFNFDPSEANLRSAKADIDAARRLAGDHPEVLQVESRHAVILGGVHEASHLLELPQMIASKNPTVMGWRAFALCLQGRYEEGLALYAEVGKLDPSNRLNVSVWSGELRSTGRGAEALAVVRDFNARGIGKLDYGDLVFAFTGEAAQLKEDVERLSESVDTDTRLAATYDVLRYERRFPEMLALLEASAAKRDAAVATIRPRGFRELAAPGIGSKPIAELYGWSKLLNRDAAAAISDGRTLLRYTSENLGNNNKRAGYLQILKAEGLLFSGNSLQAIAVARTALKMFTPQLGNSRRFATGQVARVLAWAGAEDEAVALLEDLSTKFPRLGPAEITRDPFFSIPLKNNARYQALEKKLEAAIAENQKFL